MSKEKQSGITDIDHRISFGYASGSIMEVTKAEIEPDAVSTRQTSAWPWAIWGKSNNYPQETIDANSQDTTSASALDFKIKAHYGKGPYFYRESINSKGELVKTPILMKDLPANMKAFFKRNNIFNFSQGIIQDYEWWNFYYVEYILNATYTEIFKIKWQRAVDTRSSKRDPQSGEVPSYHLSAHWPKPQSRNQVIEVPSLNRDFPLKTTGGKGMLKHELPSIDKDYYPTPKWHSNTRWLKVSRKIAVWIDANIDNSVNIKYHVEIPEQYFIDLYPESAYPEGKEACRAARQKAEKQLKEDIDACLAGAENAQKIFYTKFAQDSEGNVKPGWKINVLTNEIKDQAWLSADATAASRITSAHAVDPTLSGLRTGNSLQVGSGSDMREKFNFYLQLHTTMGRQTTTEWYDLVQQVNGWPEDIKLAYGDVYLDTLNNAKTGVVTEHEQAPTAKAA
jgi:hypothetical protein